jgi:hypothetical protein
MHKVKGESAIAILLLALPFIPKEGVLLEHHLFLLVYGQQFAYRTATANENQRLPFLMGGVQ